MNALQRIWQYIKFCLLTLITLGFYPFYLLVTRLYEIVSLLTDIREELRKK